jgi:hypothetical protein
VDDQAAITSVLNGYYSAFSTLDVQAIVHYYHEPSLFITPLGVNAVHTRADMVSGFTTIIEGLRARGFGRSELSMWNVVRICALELLVFIGMALFTLRRALRELT